MKEKYGIILEATFDKFKATMKRANGMVKSFKDNWDNAKKDVSKGFTIDNTETKEQLKEIRKNNKKTIEDYVNAIEKNPYKQGLLTNYLKSSKQQMEQSSGYKFKDDEEFLKTLKETNNELEEEEKHSKKSNLGNMFKSATKTLKRFALGLFGLQSAWRILTRASSTYISQNNKIQGAWNALGQILGPVIDYLENIFIKFIGYINEVTKAFFNLNIIAKANQSTMKRYAEQMKSFGGIDELTNLSNQEPQGLLDENAIKNQLDPNVIKIFKDVAGVFREIFDGLKKIKEKLDEVFGESGANAVVAGVAILMGLSLVGGSGLLGLLATLGAIALAIYEIIEAWKLFKEYVNLKENQQEVAEDWLNTDVKDVATIKKLPSEIKKVGRNSETASQKMALLFNILKTAKEDLKSTGNLSEDLMRIPGAQAEIEAIKEAMVELGKSGELTSNDIKRFNDLLGEEYLKLDNLGNIYITKTNQLIGSWKNLEDISESVVASNEKIGTINTNISNSANTVETSTNKAKTSVDNLYSSVKNTSDSLKELVEKPFTIKIDTQITSSNISSIGSSILSGANAISNQLNIKNIGTTIKDVMNEVIKNINSIKILGKSFNIPLLSIGTDRVKQNGLAYLHAGESVVPADVAGGGFSGDGETNNLLRELIEVVQYKDFNATISSDAIGQASVNYIRNQNRIMGGSIL